MMMRIRAFQSEKVVTGKSCCIALLDVPLPQYAAHSVLKCPTSSTPIFLPKTLRHELSILIQMKKVTNSIEKFELNRALFWKNYSIATKRWRR